MLTHRVIPVVLIRNGVVVQSKGFKRFQRLGNPTTIVKRLSEWASDELLLLDISRDGGYDLGRDDQNEANHRDILQILEEVSRHCFMPLTFGGNIRTMDDVERRIRLGADKVLLNTQALQAPQFIADVARAFGSQCVVVGIDAARRGPGSWEVMSNGGRAPTGQSPDAWARQAADLGAGEVLVQSIDEDGRGRGYDLPLIRAVTGAVDVPVVALGGVSQWEHLQAGIAEAGADAVAAANVFNYTEHSVYLAKRFLFDNRLNVREPCLGYSL